LIRIVIAPPDQSSDQPEGTYRVALRHPTDRRDNCDLAEWNCPQGDAVVPATPSADVAGLTPPPKNPLTLRQQIQAFKAFHTGQELLRDAGGHVTRLKHGPTWLMPEAVIATSPQAARDILGGTDSAAERTPAHDEVRALFGASLFTFKHDAWLPRRRALQPIFTKHNVRVFGGHMAQAADIVAGSWGDAAVIDLDTECRRLTLRALGRSVLGIDLDERADAIAEPLRTALSYVTARATRPLRPPRWLPTPARRRARSAAAVVRRLAAEILQACRDDPTHDAPLVRAMIAATDPATGRPLTDDDICNELVVFMSAGHDTTATTLTYALWALGRHPDMQGKVRAETDAIGDRELTSDDVARLPYTVQVLQEALRLCPLDSTTDHPRHRSRRLSREGRHVMHGGGLRDAPRPRTVGRPAEVRPGTVRPGERHRPRSLAVHPLQCRLPQLHRRPLRHARGHPRIGHHRPAHRNPFSERRFPGRSAFHDGRRGTRDRAGELTLPGRRLIAPNALWHNRSRRQSRPAAKVAAWSAIPFRA
jgi:cytochrome P450